MALTANSRKKLLKLVQDSKRILFQEIKDQLQQYYGIFPQTGQVVAIEELTTSDADVLYNAKLLRDRLKYLANNLADSKNENVESVEQLIREQAFTVLNRLAALRMAEERGIIRESIKNSYTSEGFQVYDSITGQGATTNIYTRYKWYLYAIFDELSIDLPSVFDKFSPYAIIFPSERSLQDLLNLINNEDLEIHREEGLASINLWQQDETIGWIYQYYNSREEITEMREASGAPRNSRELAVRNQFFTPRYVVQFLTDNSLGRIWYEMTKGNTEFIHKCQYLIRRPQELFLDKGKQRPENADEETDYIEHREIKDPREILMLDPACGSMHFGLYSFDLFEQIYIEAWDNHNELMLDLKNSITRADFIKQIPEYIIRYNIHGVDIDPRALQIAALSLWLRAQKSFDKLGLEPANRPQITKSNLVLAEPMPVNPDFLSEVVKTLDAPMRKLVLEIWELMKMAGEAGLLLRIENEIDSKIQEIAKNLQEESKNSQMVLGANKEQLLAAEQSAVYASKQYKEDFLNNAEEKVLHILKSLAENANDDKAYQKLLFAEDTARGFDFIELCRKKYDVIVMNPPFGAASMGAKNYIDRCYPTSKNDLASVFIERMLELLETRSMLGSITTRTIFFLGSYTNWRSKYLIDENSIKYFADLGGGVLDAMVETAAYVIEKGKSINDSIFYRLTKEYDKEKKLLTLLNSVSKTDTYLIDSKTFKAISNEPFCYWIDSKTIDLFTKSEKFENNKRGARLALKTADNWRYVRNHWEVISSNIASNKQETFTDKNWSFFLMSDSSSRFFMSVESLVLFGNDGNELKSNINDKGQLRSRPMDSYNVFYSKGLSWSFRTAKFQPHIISEGNIATSGRCIAVFENENDILYINAFWNSEYIDYCLKLSMEKDLQPKFINGTVNQLPFPTLPIELQNKLQKITINQFYRVKEVYRTDHKSLSFTSNKFIKFSSLNPFINDYLVNLKEIKKEYNQQLLELNNIVYDHFNITINERADIINIVSAAGNDNEGKIFNLTHSELINRVFTVLIGIALGRWDIRLLKFWNEKWSDENMFKASKHSPFLYGMKRSTLNLILPEFHKEIENIWELPYPIKTLKENASVKDLTMKIREVIQYFWPETASTIEFELQEHYGVTDNESIFTNPNKFFDVHLKDYTRNKRISPIYWPISTASGSYTIWLYYPKLTDQTLVSVINNDLQPKIDEVSDNVKRMENNNSIDNRDIKELKVLQDFLHELEVMKKELLDITSLPYKPNHDDGVLITAAPLYKLFRHSKWRKSTEECWKKLEKGDYDWAHLAYNIWPERVTKKCKKDLSMAIAHNLESICEIKPKVVKEKVKKEPKEIKKVLKLNL